MTGIETKESLEERQKVYNLIKEAGYNPTEINVEDFQGINVFVFGIKSDTSRNVMEVLFDLSGVFEIAGYRVTLKSIRSKTNDIDAYRVSEAKCM